MNKKKYPIEVELEDYEIDPTPKNNKIRSEKECDSERCHFKKNNMTKGEERTNDFNMLIEPWEIKDAENEAKRCLRCVEPPCQKSCPAFVNVPEFIHALSNANPYGAAISLFSSNPLAYTCGLLCPTTQLCTGGCNLNKTSGGAIKIGNLQRFACEQFMHMDIEQIIDPEIEKTRTQPVYTKPIALIGAGPSSIACGSFLARMGYKNITIFERNKAAGGLPLYQIPQYRVPEIATQFEVKLAKDLGIKFVYGKELGKDFTISSLKEKEGFEAVFIGVGKVSSKSSAIFEVQETKGLYDSQIFLRKVSSATKNGIPEGDHKLPTLEGHTVVVGAGDTAIDCALTAFRCGSKRVTVLFPKEVSGMNFVEEESELVRSDQTELIGFSSPKEVLVENGKVTGLLVEKIEKEWDGKSTVDVKETRKIKCNNIIVSSETQVDKNPLSGLSFDPEKDLIEISRESMQTKKLPWVFAGGDCVGSKTIVAAVSDGKLAALGIHKHLLEKHGIEPTPDLMKIPDFRTPVDLVDLSVEVAGLKFPNPFGLASGPGTENYGMIKRAFEAGWGWAVTKTCSFDKDFVRNVSPRITECQGENNFINIELNADRSWKYWIKAIKQLKKEFPKKILIASIHSKGMVEDWKQIAKEFADSGADGLQLNFICPNLGKGGDGFESYEQMVYLVCKGIKEITNIPLFPKLSSTIPHGDLSEVTREAHRGGAAGISAINSMSGLSQILTTSDPWPYVGDSKLSGYGGISGTQIRPYALKAVTEIATAVPNIPILGCGGIDSANSALQMIHAGASVIQICSAVMSYGYKIIHELRSGVQWYLYSLARKDLCQWDSQYHPRPKLFAPDISNLYPSFGEFEPKYRKIKQEKLADSNLFAKPKFDVKKINLSDIPRLATQSARATPKIVDFEKLDVNYAVRAVVNYDTCLNCGKCFVSCHDSAHQAISFDSKKHLPFIDLNKCIGCGLCAAVCPSRSIHLQDIKQLPFRAVINHDECIQCGTCVSVCHDKAQNAIAFDPESDLPIVDLKKCIGCGLCSFNCPVKCIRLEDVKKLI
ncbi:dihydropyrimidine dehydrogenase [NADP(+)] [Anaeramoeba ignava]|uniref:dihydropyrimidine dehydrogenase (NADP(+)) n=1 Tax=Anaeramoeba ignava TaxID=1746090 RepID=A0A9Q0LTN5_ANAIG|nr:dihydropyrimidine dehydrogenase [NADP(+)] [Anaeramoeba ignava]|eukprot:Anaeramoba_ignava/a608088_107.p1 GENE.a608088_107~~a608088_107.p1  ORF type:complete len:1057 (-),score=330.14 a608088_107:354-3503(-)